MKMYEEVEVLTLHILNFGIKLSWVVSFTFRSLYTQGKSPRYSLGKKLVGSQRRSGRSRREEKKNPFIAPPRNWAPVL